MSSRGAWIGSVQVASNKLQVDKEFWAVFLNARDAKRSVVEVQRAGGTLIYDHQTKYATHFF